MSTVSDDELLLILMMLLLGSPEPRDARPRVLAPPTPIGLFLAQHMLLTQPLPLEALSSPWPCLNFPTTLQNLCPTRGECGNGAQDLLVSGVTLPCSSTHASACTHACTHLITPLAYASPHIPLQVADWPWASGPEDSLAFTVMDRQDGEGQVLRTKLCTLRAPVFKSVGWVLA